MIIKNMMTKRFCLALGAALSVTGVLVSQKTGPAPDPEGSGIVYVYYASLCAMAGDSRDCQEVLRPARPAFDSMAVCALHADGELGRAHNPRLMASCLKQREI